MICVILDMATLSFKQWIHSAYQSYDRQFFIQVKNFLGDYYALHMNMLNKCDVCSRTEDNTLTLITAQKAKIIKPLSKPPSPLTSN